jgi:hypothetical protein
MKRYHDLERLHRRLVRDITDLMVNVPDGQAASAARLAALYKVLSGILSEELKLEAELSLGAALTERIKCQREYALFCAEHWRGEAAAHLDAETGAAVPAG